MDAVATDPIAELLAAGEGKFEWVRGSLVGVGSSSDEHDDQMVFLASVMRSFAETHDAGRVKADQYPERLEPSIVRLPDVAFFKKDNVGKMKPTYSEGGADLVIEIVSPDSKGRDRGDKFYEYETAGIEEYWIVDSARQAAEFYRLRDSRYESVRPDEQGRMHSSALPGFFVRVEWLWTRPRIIDALRELGLF